MWLCISRGVNMIDITLSGPQGSNSLSPKYISGPDEDISLNPSLTQRCL